MKPFMIVQNLENPGVSYEVPDMNQVQWRAIVLAILATVLARDAHAVYELKTEFPNYFLEPDHVVIEIKRENAK